MLSSLATIHNPLFASDNNGKSCLQPVSINAFGKISSQIMSYLRLPKWYVYNRRSFRQSSVTLLADVRGVVLELKGHGHWKLSIGGRILGGRICAIRNWDVKSNFAQRSNWRSMLRQFRYLEMLEIRIHGNCKQSQI